MLNRIVAACWLSLGALVSFNVGIAQAQNAATFPSGGGGGTPGGSNTQLQYNASAAFAGMSGTAWDDTNRALTLTGATVTADHPIFDLSQTWNNAAVGFTAFKMNITHTASNFSTDYFLDLQNAGASKFHFDIFGNMFMTGHLFLPNKIDLGEDGFPGITVAAGYAIGWSSDANVVAGPDAMFTRAGPGAIRIGALDAAAPVAQTLQAQSVVAGTSNTAGTDLSINASAGTGTGAGGSVVFQVAPAGSTGTAQNALVKAMVIDTKSHIRVGAQTAPALTSCGTSPAIVGDDTAATVTMGTSTPTGCVITFKQAYANAPICTVTWRATALASQSYAVSTTAITLTQTATNSNVVDFICRAQSGG